jgi:micrococcal nuclease
LAAIADGATLASATRARIFVLLTILTLPLACGGTHGGPSAGTVAEVLDGDTITLTDGRHVRLVQLDAPETDEGECYAQEAKRVLVRLLPPGAHVEIETDLALDQRDRFGRLLAYLKRDGTNVNLELVRAGAASVWFYEGDRGRYAAQFLDAAEQAKTQRRGLWRACPRTALEPLHAVEARK